MGAGVRAARAAALDMMLAVAPAVAASRNHATATGPSASACVHCARRCRFQFGTFFRKDAPPAQVRASSYLTVWLGTRSKAYGYGFNPYWHGRMLERVRAQNGTAVYYSYVRARPTVHAPPRASDAACARGR